MVINIVKSNLLKNYLLNTIPILFSKTPKIIIALIVRIFIKQRKYNGGDTIFYSKYSEKITILMLDSDRYRGDLEILSKSNKFRVLHIRQIFQSLLTNIFLKGDVTVQQLSNIKSTSNLYNQHTRTISLFRKVLKYIYYFINIDCVTTVHFKYVPDYYWTLISEELSVPYICLHRECNLLSPTIRDRVVRMMNLIGRFHGSHIVVHNKRCKEVFVETNFASNDQVTICGALRMDEIGSSKLVQHNNFITDKKKVFTLFYFPVVSTTFCIDKFGVEKYGINTGYWITGKSRRCWEFNESLFTLLHLKILSMAKKYEDIDFIIKVKPEFKKHYSWKFYENFLNDSDIDWNRLKNYRIESDVDVRSLINKSNVVCGLQSSTTVESIFMDKKVIIPLFKELHKTKYYDQFPWRDYEDLCCIVEDDVSFEREVLASFDSSLPEYIVDKDRSEELFKECFGFNDGESLSRYENIIIGIVSK